MTTKLIDTHLHGVDFLQETDGLLHLLEKMDHVGLDEAVIFGLPVNTSS